MGNLLGAIIPLVESSKDPANETFGFIADLHSLTTIKDAEVRRENTYAVAASYLACGFDIDKNVFYRQSDVPEVCELARYLQCFMSFNRLQLAHSFKDKSENVSEVNAGLFVYPMLMAAATNFPLNFCGCIRLQLKFEVTDLGKKFCRRVKEM